jgi:hypothetical protein
MSKILIALSVLGFTLFLAAPKAHASVYENALKATLESESLTGVKQQISAFELTRVKVSQVKGSKNEYLVELFYSALGTAGGCTVNAKAKVSTMEIVAPGGGGFKQKEVWAVNAKLGICPR